MTNYELWYADDLGNRLAFISDVRQFRYARVLGDIGMLSIDLPKRHQLYDNQDPDRRIHVYRQAPGSSLKLEMIALLRRFNISSDKAGLLTFAADGYDLNELLARRIVAYYADSAQSSMATTEADDMMKEIVRDNFIDNADYSGTPSPARDIDTYGFSVASDTSAGPTLSKSFAWRIVLNTLQDIQAASRVDGPEVFFGFVPVTETTAQFMTWVDPPDRTITGSQPVVFSLEWGNLLTPSIQHDYSNEANAVYAGGQGQGSSRVIATAKDTARIGASSLNRREAFAFSSGSASATVEAEAEAELERRRPKLTVSGTLLSTPLTPYGGLDGWSLGDKVTVSYAGLQFNVVIRSVMVSVAANGKETITSRIENE